MKERPIIMTGHSVRAILDGRKTQTRRIVSKDIGPLHGDPVQFMEPHELAFWSSDPEKSPHVMVSVPFHVGDRLWVRESVALGPACNDPNPEDEDDWHVFYRATEDDGRPWLLGTDENTVEVKPPWKSPLFMPRWASRLTLVVVEVGVERVNAISWADIKAEGVDCPEHDGPGTFCVSECHAARAHFAKAWNDVNGKRAPWSNNPWVWVVTFRRVEGKP